MRNQKTVLVLGAGASKGFGLPLGKELKSVIANDLNILFDDFGTKLKSGSYEIVDALRLLTRDDYGRSGSINPHRNAAVKIATSMGLSGSIDEYIERHSDDTLRADCAKLGISKAILQAERKSSIYYDSQRSNNAPLRNATDNWLAYILRDLTRGLSKGHLSSAFENIFIINFNYDRCVEQFTYLWLQQIYELSEPEAAEIAKNLRIFHPYGKLAALPYQNPHEHIAFGGQIDGHRLVQMSRSIRTYSEAVEDQVNLDMAHRELFNSDKLVFMGFGFHQQNLNILTLPEGDFRSKLRCFATVDGISESKLGICRPQIGHAVRIDNDENLLFHQFRGDCEGFWDEYGDVIVH